GAGPPGPTRHDVSFGQQNDGARPLCATVRLLQEDTRATGGDVQLIACREPERLVFGASQVDVDEPSVTGLEFEPDHGPSGCDVTERGPQTVALIGAADRQFVRADIRGSSTAIGIRELRAGEGEGVELSLASRDGSGEPV